MKLNCSGEIDVVFCKMVLNYMAFYEFTYYWFIGLYPNRSVLSDPLGIGTILAVFLSEGKVLLEMDMLNKVVREQCLQQ